MSTPASPVVVSSSGVAIARSLSSSSWGQPVAASSAAGGPTYLNPPLAGPVSLPNTTTGWWKISIGRDFQSWKFDTANRTLALQSAQALEALGLNPIVTEARQISRRWAHTANPKDVVSLVQAHLLPAKTS